MKAFFIHLPSKLQLGSPSYIIWKGGKNGIHNREWRKELDKR